MRHLRESGLDDGRRDSASGPSIITAIVHLRGEARERVGPAVEPPLRLLRGIGDVRHDWNDALVAVDYDARQTGVADIVRVIEDAGWVVSSIAQRPQSVRKAG